MRWGYGVGVDGLDEYAKLSGWGARTVAVTHPPLPTPASLTFPLPHSPTLPPPPPLHPRSNPGEDAADRFAALQRAYEYLQGSFNARNGAGNAGTAPAYGPDPSRLLLVLRAQCVLYRRYPKQLSEFKYAGYPMLLRAVQVRGGGWGDDVRLLLSLL